MWLTALLAGITFCVGYLIGVLMSHLFGISITKVYLVWEWVLHPVTNKSVDVAIAVTKTSEAARNYQGETHEWSGPFIVE